MRCASTSVSVWERKVCPRFSRAFLMVGAFSMMPLWMTAIRPDWSRCGCAFGVVGAPWVSQRVCPTPTVPVGAATRSRSASIDSFPADFSTSSPLPLITATPAESYPRYSMRRRPSIRIGEACFGPTYPTIPHMARTTSRLELSPASGQQLLRLAPGRRLRNQPEHRLGARRSKVHPFVPPSQSEPVALVGRGVRESGLQGRVSCPQVATPLGFGLYDHISWRRRNQRRY